jgi:A/G-specific adenine glycosylase
MKYVDVDIAIVVKAGQVLICQRHPDGFLGGYWEFPGGKREAGETSAACAIREVKEEVGIDVRPVNEFDVIEHAYAHAQIRLHPHLCHHLTGDPRSSACQQIKWVPPLALRDYTFPPANDTLIEQVIRHLAPEPS